MIDYTNFKDKSEIIEFINQYPAIYYKKIKAFNKQLYNDVMAIGKKTLAENMYIYLHGEQGCQRCGVPTAFQNIIIGYRQNCKACYEFMRARKELWGPPPKCINELCNNPAFGENVNTGKWNLHCSLKCRGIHNSLISREKSKQTCLTKYGESHYSKTKEGSKKNKQRIIN